MVTQYVLLAIIICQAVHSRRLLANEASKCDQCAAVAFELGIPTKKACWNCDCGDGKRICGCVHCDNKPKPLQCPDTRPSPDDSCPNTDVKLECSYGEEHCCGESHASVISFCEPNQETWISFHTEACFIPNCDDERQTLPPGKAQEPKEYCSNGVANGNVCCAASCGTCGGSGCSGRSGGSSKCCHRSILRQNRKCESGKDTACVIPTDIDMCNWKCYLDRYPDVDGFGNGLHGDDLDSARAHYLLHGEKEGRDCTCSPPTAGPTTSEPTPSPTSAPTTEAPSDASKEVFWKLGSTGANCRDVCKRIGSECVASQLWPQSSEWVRRIAKDAGVQCASTRARCDFGEAPVLTSGSQCLFCDNPRHPGWGENKRYNLCTRRYGNRKRICPCAKRNFKSKTSILRSAKN